MMTQVTLTALELRICREIARIRTDENRKANVVDHKMSRLPGIVLDQRGVCGEFAVAKYVNAYPDFTTQIRRGGWDLVYRGWRVDVKNRHPYGDLMTPATKHLDDADLYVCVNGDNPYNLLGWCWAGELINKKNLRDFGHGGSYFLDYRKLKAIETLLNVARKGD